MSFAYDSDVEESWRDLSKIRINAPASRFNYSLLKLKKQKKVGDLSDAAKHKLLCNVIDDPEMTFDKSEWKFASCRTSCTTTNSYLCLCSLPTNKYFIVQNSTGLSVRVGAECIDKLLSGSELESAQRTMQLDMIRITERRRAKLTSRI